MSNLIIAVRVVKDDIGLDYTASIEMTAEEVANSPVGPKFAAMARAAERKLHAAGVVK